MGDTASQDAELQVITERIKGPGSRHGLHLRQPRGVDSRPRSSGPQRRADDLETTTRAVLAKPRRHHRRQVDRRRRRHPRRHQRHRDLGARALPDRVQRRRRGPASPRPTCGPRPTMPKTKRTGSTRSASSAPSSRCSSSSPPRRAPSSPTTASSREPTRSPASSCRAPRFASFGPGKVGANDAIRLTEYDHSVGDGALVPITELLNVPG